MIDEEFDVIVVGGGPSGSACSTFLSQRGLRVLVIEKSKFPRDKICGDCINPHTWRFLEVLDVASELRARDLRTIKNVRISNTMGKELSLQVPSSPSAPFIALDRKILDDILLKNARRSGAKVLQEAKILGIAKAGSWIVSTQDREGPHQFISRYLVGADGRNSYVAGKIGAKMRSLFPFHTPIRVGVQWHTKFQPDVGADIRLYKFEGGYCGVVNVDDQTANVAMVTEPAVSRLASSDFFAFVERTALRNPSCARACSDLSPLQTVHVTTPVNPFIRKTRTTDAFLVGDARRTLEPFTGEGICFAIQDGILTAMHILKLTDANLGQTHIPTRTSLWVNRVFSPVLQSHRVTEFLISLASKQAWMARIFGRMVFPEADARIEMT